MVTGRKDGEGGGKGLKTSIWNSGSVVIRKVFVLGVFCFFAHRWEFVKCKRGERLIF